MSFYFTSACARSCPVLDPQTLKTNPMCFTALTERIQAGLRFEQGCDFCQHVCLCVNQSCNNNVQLLVISVAMFAFSVVFVVLGFVSFWWFSSLHFVFFLSIFFSLFLSDFVSQCDQVQVIPIPSVCIIFFILRACLCIYFHLLRETCLTSFFWDAFSFYTTLHKECSILENSHILCINDRRI